MAGSVNKVIGLYQSGKSIPDVAAAVGISRSTVRYHLAKASALRSRADGVRLAREKLGSGFRGKSRVFTPAHCQAISDGRNKWAEENAIGTSNKQSGYVEITRGEHKGRSVHVVIMEQRIGRRLKPDEVVHHIDGNRSNNSDDNLALMTRAAHTRLHQREKRFTKGI
jgi:HNH endonuclease